MEIDYRDILVIVGFLVLMIMIGFLLSVKSKKPLEFMIAGRSLPGWLIGFSIFATSTSNISFLGEIGKSYSSNWLIMVQYLVMPVSVILAIKYFIPFHRKNGSASAYTHLEKRFGAWASLFASSMFLLMCLFRMATIMYLMSIALAPILGANVHIAIGVIGLIVILYTYLGGLEAVVWTDLLQGILFFGGALVVGGYLLMHMPEGPMQLFHIASEQNKFSLGDLSLTLNDSTIWVMILFGLSIDIPCAGIDQERVQRYMAAKSSKDARLSLWWSLSLMIIFHAAVLFVGTGMYSFYAANVDLAQDVGVSSLKADLVFSYFIATQLPLGIKGILVAAILASGMSSIDSALNSLSTVFVSNIYHRYLNRHPGERKTMRMLQRSSVIAGAISIAGALGMSRVQSVWDFWYATYAILAGGMFGLFLLGMISKKARNQDAIKATVCSVLISTWMALSPKMAFLPWYLKNPMSAFMTGIVGTVAIVVFGLIFSRFSKDKEDSVYDSPINMEPMNTEL